MRFRRRLLDALASHQSTAQAFGPTWEATLEEVPLDDQEQALIYWQLIAWVRSDELFTGPDQRELLHVWKETVHEV